MQIPKKKIESSLKRKGFLLDASRDHRYLHFVYQDKIINVSTCTSHGSSKYKDYKMNLLKKMKNQLSLDSLDQLKNLIDCPLSKEDYIKILKDKGII